MNQRGHILIADDEETFLLATADLLRAEGYACDCVSDASDALRLLRSDHYDVLIADIRMPGNPELELVKVLSEEFGGLPVILVTGYPSVDSAIKSVELPVTAYLLKPVDLPELMRQVDTAAQRGRYRSALLRSRTRLSVWQQELESLQDQLTVKADSHTEQAILASYIDVTLQNILTGLGDLHAIAKHLAGDQHSDHTCKLTNCPRTQTLSAAIDDTIVTLEKTKRSFKSKDLGDLRRRLQEVLGNIK